MEATKTLDETKKEPPGAEPKVPVSKAPRLQLLQRWKPEDELWQQQQGTILIVGDNLAIVDIINGRQTYQGADPLVNHLLREATDNLVGMLDLGWTLKDSNYDMVQWRDRSWNFVADEVANRAMNEQCNHEWWTNKRRAWTSTS